MERDHSENLGVDGRKLL